MTKGLGWVMVLVLGVLSLPLAATVLDGRATEDLLFPVQLIGMALVGGLTGVLLPGFATGETPRRFAVGAAYGVVTALVGAVVYFFLLSGVGGA